MNNMEGELMKLSVIIPVFNSEKYIENCLDSLLINNKIELEIIIINDCSNDNTRSIVEKKYSFPFVKLFNNLKNMGVSYSRNYGLSKATGDYIMFVDSDDFLSSDWSLIVSEGIKSKKDIIYFSDRINENIKIDKLYEYIIGYNNVNICMGGPFSKIFKRVFLEKNKLLFNTNLINGEDMMFNIMSLKKSKSHAIISKSFYNYRIFNGSSTKKFDLKIINNDITFNNLLREIFDDSEHSYLCNYCLINGLYMIINRISYVKKYRIAKKNIKSINLKYYNINNFKLYKINNINIFKKFILIILKLKFYFLVYLILKVKNKRKFNKEKKEIIYVI